MGTGWVDHSLGSVQEVSAFFVDTSARLDKDSPNEMRKVAKFGGLLLTLYVGSCWRFGVVEMNPREVLVSINCAVFVARLALELITWQRRITFNEIFFEAFVILPVSLFSMKYRAETPGGSFALMVAGEIIFIVGTMIILGYESHRYIFKAKRENNGRLFMGGLSRILQTRHPNYFGEIISFIGFAMVSRYPFFALWVPVTMGLGLVFFSVKEIDHYLQIRYPKEFTKFTEVAPYSIIPLVR